MEEMEAMTVLSLGIGTRNEHSKSSRTGLCKLKLPVQFHELFPAQLLERTDHNLVMVRKESKAAKRTCYSSLEYHEDSEKSNGHSRKKLRLNEEQLTVLETVYEEHSNLDPAIKQGLAEQLKIKPRQVEVWFQNRRARSKQRQTEADCENLKRWCEGLNKENQILKKDLQELMRVPHPGLLQPDKTHEGPNLVAMCSSCNRMMIREPPNLMKL